MSIRDQLSGLAPAEVWDFVKREERSRPLKPGDIAPPVSLRDVTGAKIFSESWLRTGPLVVTFYRGLWCPYCRTDLEEMQQAHAGIIAKGAKVAAICDSLDGKMAAAREAEISGYPVFQDQLGDAAVKFGIRWHPDEVDVINDLTGNNLTAFRGTDPWIVPMQARFVIDQTAHIRFADIVYDYALRTGPSAFMSALDEVMPPT